MSKRHSDQWEILRIQGKIYQREKIALYAIIILLIIALVLSNIVWVSRHNSETASAATSEIRQADETTLPPEKTVKTTAYVRRNGRRIKDTGD